MSRHYSDPAATGSDAPSGLDILHVDMDAFFASVEVLDRPELSGKPVVVGGTGDRGVVASCTYEARAYGIRSAMATHEARRLCPRAAFIGGRFWRYQAVSRRLHDVLESFTPLVEAVGLDEAYLDVSGAHRLFGAGGEIARTLRETVLQELGLTCSVGVARTKLVAKLASEAAKPVAAVNGARPGRGVVVVEPEGEAGFLSPLPTSALRGVGPVATERLSRLGVRSIGDLVRVPRDSLIAAFGESSGVVLYDLARGHDPSTVDPGRPPRSIGHEETFAADQRAPEVLHRQVVRMADGVAVRLRQAGLAGRTVTLKVRFGDRATITRSRTVSPAVDAGPAIAGLACRLMDEVDLSAGVRLLGVSMSGLQRAGVTQLQLAGEDRWAMASSAVDAVRSRFGHAALGPAVLADRSGLAVKRRGDTQWGPSAERPAELGMAGAQLAPGLVAAEANQPADARASSQEEVSGSPHTASRLRVVEAPGLREDGFRGPGRGAGPDREGGGRAAFRG